MVRNELMLVFLLAVACANTAVAEVGLSLKADKRSIALGEPLTVELRVEDVREPVSDINLDKLKQSFNVYGISTAAKNFAKQGHRYKNETMTLTLYALRAGRLQIPPLSYRGKSTKTVHISVLEFSKQMPRVMVKTAIDTSHPLVRQACTLMLDVYDDGSLQWTVPREIVATGAHQRRLAESLREEVLEGILYKVHSYAWALMPLREGAMTVEFPMLDAFKFGTRLRYPVAPMKLDVAPVPAYLPVHVPIGKPVLTARPLPEKIALDRPVNRVLSIKGNGISIEGVSKLLSSIQSNESLHFYPAKAGGDENARLTTATQTLLVTLPFVPLRSGILKLPEINLPYYDPVSERIESVFVPSASIEVFNPLWILVKKTAFGVFFLAGLFGFSYKASKWAGLALHRRKSLLAISNAKDAEELLQLLLKYNGGLSTRTLQQWLANLRAFYTVDKHLIELVQKLEMILYGESTAVINIASLAQEIAERLKKLSRK